MTDARRQRRRYARRREAGQVASEVWCQPVRNADACSEQWTEDRVDAAETVEGSG